MITKRKLSFWNPWTPKTWSTKIILINHISEFPFPIFTSSDLETSEPGVSCGNHMQSSHSFRRLWCDQKKLTQLCQDDKMRMATYICCAFRKPCLNLKKRDMDWHFKFLMPKIREVTLLASQFMAFKALSSKDSPAGLHGSFRADLGQLKHESSRLS